MGILALDIETASPGEEPNGEFQNTDYFELVAVALGYRPDSSSEIESEVLFRNGGWEREHTAKLLNRVAKWTDDREIEQVLTYNGTGFDFVHLREWARTLDNELDTGIEEYITKLDGKQVDLRYPATEYHSDLMRSDHDFPKLERVCEARSIPTTETKYADYDIDSNFLGDYAHAEAVKGRHIGELLGEKYVTCVTNGLEHTQIYQELKSLLSDYARGDIRPLFDLYDSFDESDCKRVSAQSQT